jgi:uncharacterized protein
MPVYGPVYSPCNQVCSIDNATGLCKGCFRSLNEIARWGQLSDAQKMTVWRALDAREQQAMQSARALNNPPQSNSK